MTILDEFRSDRRRVLDRLVDGELGLHERRELLAGLDDEPGAWRRCALAFLESQSWRWQLSRMASEPILAQLSAAPPKTRAARHTIWGGFLAIAASLMVAFTVGTRFPTIGPADDALAAVEQSAPKVADTVSRPELSPAPHELATTDGDPAGTTSDSPWQIVTLTPVGDTGDPIELRVVKDGAGQLFADRLPLSSFLTGRLEQDGWEVIRRRRLLPIDLSDGRRLVVPIEEIDLHRPDVWQF